jgi:hypothetical protein
MPDRRRWKNIWGSKYNVFGETHFYSIFFIPAEAGSRGIESILGPGPRGSDPLFDFFENIRE